MLGHAHQLDSHADPNFPHRLRSPITAAFTAASAAAEVQFTLARRPPVALSLLTVLLGSSAPLFSVNSAPLTTLSSRTKCSSFSSAPLYGASGRGVEGSLCLRSHLRVLCALCVLCVIFSLPSFRCTSALSSLPAP